MENRKYSKILLWILTEADEGDLKQFAKAIIYRRGVLHEINKTFAEFLH